jgi:hypothetical protein
MFKKNFIINFTEFLFFFFILALWATRLFVEWGTDYGIYYAGSFFISTLFENTEEYRLYEEFFDHKGPVYYLFLKLVGYIIGWGHYQSFVSLYLSILVFYIPIYLIIKKNTKTFTSSIFFLLLALLLISNMPTNASIGIFQMGLITISFYYLLQAKNNLFFFNISYLFFILAVFTRIDSIFFIFPFLYFFYLRNKIEKNYMKQILIYIILIPSSLLFILTEFFGSSFNQFYNHNITFNFWYSDIETQKSLKTFLINILKKEHFTLLTKSLLLPIAIFLMAKIFAKINTNLDWDYLRRKVLSGKNFKESIMFLIILSAILVWTRVFDKNYHLLVLSISLFFVIVNLCKFLGNFKYLQITFIPFLLWSLSTDMGFVLKLKNNNFSCIHDYFCEESDLKNYEKTINFINTRNMNEVHIVGGRGWAYFFSNTKPARTINDWVFFYGYSSKELISSHKKLLNKEKGYLFWIDNKLFEKDNTKNSKLFLEIIDGSQYIESQGRYSMYQIK